MIQVSGRDRGQACQHLLDLAIEEGVALPAAKKPALRCISNLLLEMGSDAVDPAEIVAKLVTQYGMQSRSEQSGTPAPSAKSTPGGKSTTAKRSSAADMAREGQKSPSNSSSSNSARAYTGMLSFMDPAASFACAAFQTTDPALLRLLPPASNKRSKDKKDKKRELVQSKRSEPVQSKKSEPVQSKFVTPRAASGTAACDDEADQSRSRRRRV